ncbi:MAG: asparagine synthase C-terminal domain-containing protein, partial [Sulfurimicrobium sp.]|nr:asparagine synthase C-terminal domain-containing protein [Sulfurimicrobium sp.]
IAIGFEADGYDEMEYARIAARRFSTQHHEYYVTPDDVVAAIPQIAAIFDQPFGNASAVPAFYCSRMAKADGLSRILGGDGGDELFGGNERYAKQTIFSLYERLPAVLRRSILEPAIFNMPGGRKIPLVRKARSYIEQASVPMPARLETYNLLERYGHEQVFTREFLATTDVGQPLSLLNETYRQAHAQSLINHMLALDLKFTLADNDLPKVVKACELAGMEVAFPFLNDEMVAFSARLAPELKLKGTKLRYFFKEALRGTLPDEIITKQKHGFGLPFGVWLQTHKPLQALAADSLSDLKSRRIIRVDFIDKLLGQHLDEHAGYHGTMVWVLMMLEQWFKQR